MSTKSKLLLPAWLTDEDEMPHSHEGLPKEGWSENYLSYVWSPENQIGVYIHLCCRPGNPTVWEEQFHVALPGDMYLASKAIAPGNVEGGPTVCGVDFKCVEPHVKWVKRFEGAARLVSGEEMRSGPLQDGACVPVEMELEYLPMSPVYDFGGDDMPKQAWGKGHYEQHNEVRGWISYNGQRHEIKGTGFRDHSWGVRYYSQVGFTTWLHGQFPKSGRSFMGAILTGIPPIPRYSIAVVSDRTSVTSAKPITPVPIARTLADTDAPVELNLQTPDGKIHVIKGTVMNSLRAAFVGDSELGLGTYDATNATHHYVDSFAQFEWDGEIGYGIIERSVDLLNEEMNCE